MPSPGSTACPLGKPPITHALSIACSKAPDSLPRRPPPRLRLH